MIRHIWGSIIVTAAVLLLLAAVLAGGGTTAHAARSATGDQGRPRQPLGTWQDIAPFPTVSVSPTPGTYPLRLKRANAAAYPPNGKIYVLGGRHGVDGEDSAMSRIWEYSPGSPGTWVQKTAQIDPGSQGSIYSANMAVAVLTDTTGARIYAIGGSSINSQPTPVVRVYNPVADSITTLTTDPWPANPVRVPGGWAVSNNKLYIFGGFSSLANGGTGGVFTDTWRFDPLAPAGSRWTQLPTANLNLGRGYIAGAALDGYIYAIGGDLPTGNPTNPLAPVTNVERMDPAQANPVWVGVANLPTARGDMGAWAYDSSTNYEISGKIAVAGGHYDIPDNQGYLYTPGTNSWAVFPNLVHPTRNYGYAQLDGYLYAFGGYDYTNNLPNGANWNQRYNANLPTTLLVGHVTWQGRPPQPDALNQLPLTLTLKLGTSVTSYPNQTTNASGVFTVSVSTVPSGTYTWWVKGPRWLAATGSVTLNGAPVTQQEMGLQLAGDADNSNSVDTLDFSILRATFGLVCANPGYDTRADFSGDCLVDTTDFSLLRSNFGLIGPPQPTGPLPAQAP